MTSHTNPPPHVLREYALLADGERGAIVGPRGDIVWLCAPTWECPAVFSSLIGGTSAYLVEPAERYVWGGWYEPSSLIWRSRWITCDGVVECREALSFPGDPHRLVLLRQPRSLDAPAGLQVTLHPRAGYDAQGLRDLHHEHGVWTGRVGPLYLRWSCGPGARVRDDRLALRLDLAAGESRDLVLEISDRRLPDEPPDPDSAWSATEAAWNEAVPEFANTLAPHDCRQSYAVLRGLTSHGGGMVAAATMSLPERAEEGRNYDYRYVWIRDQCYVGQAVAADGPHPLLDAAVRFVSERLLADGDKLIPAYTTSGDPVPGQDSLPLPGYPGGFDLVGNHVREQFQLDAFGESLLLLAAAARHDRLEPHGWDAARAAATAIERRWREPDAGIWELHDAPWTHSRLIAAAGLRAAAGQRGDSGEAAAWLALADAITADTAKHAVHPDGRWQRAADDPGLDGALLYPALRGAIPADDPRSVATLRAYLDKLTVNGYAYRFRHDDRPLADAEGSFLLCGFLVALGLQQQGDLVEARAWYERTRAACGPPQLFSEEYDAVQHQMRGNLPQAFVHALMLEASARLAAAE
ncbi:MAG TPA: glycoside hydrolase family 15 protein [Jatrophihabitans sp.]|nr:glycoside hydrolase family 15 protein [Jatrophihabitans sp.]